MVLILWVHGEWKPIFSLFLLGTFVWGYGAEVMGVNIGFPFGNYSYGPVLGPKLWNTPLMIGVNWILVTYACGTTTNNLIPALHWAFKGFLTSLLMVGLDALIEPVAISFNFWSWEGGSPPLSNYLGWLGVALPPAMFFHYHFPKVRNKAGVALFIWQLLFFALLNMFS